MKSRILIKLNVIKEFFWNSPIRENENKDKMNINYIESGYENLLKQYLSRDDINVLFINGKFGSGKTTALNHILENIKKEQNKIKIKKLKVYEEYVEDNYIDYLYNSFTVTDSGFNKWKHKQGPILLISFLTVLIFVGSVYITEIIKTSANIKAGVALKLLTLFFLLTFLKADLEKNKADKIKYIQKEMKKYTYYVIDDLDRVYIEAKEILKMIHFLRDNINEKQKLVLLGDKRKFTEYDLDILEKYYDVLFEIPIEVISKQIVQEIEKEIYEVEHNDNLDKIIVILQNLTPRILVKIKRHIIDIQRTEMFDAIKRLYRSDYLFILVLYYENTVSLEDVFECIENIKSFPVVEEEDIKETIIADKLKEIEKLNLKKESENYMKSAYKYHVGINEDLEWLTNRRSNKTYEPGKYYQWRIFGSPEFYKINSFVSEKESIDELTNNFEYNLYNDVSKTSYPMNEIYKEKIGQNEYLELVKKRIEEVDDDNNKNLYSRDLRNKVAKDFCNTINLLYFYIYETSFRGLADKATYNAFYEERETFFESWDKLYVSNKLRILEIESLNDKTVFIDYIKEYKREEISYIIDEMIRIERPYNFMEIFGEEEAFASKEQVLKLLEIYHEYLKAEKSKCTFSVHEYEGIQPMFNYSLLKHYNQFKEQVHKLYEIDVEKFSFSMDE